MIYNASIWYYYKIYNSPCDGNRRTILCLNRFLRAKHVNVKSITVVSLPLPSLYFLLLLFAAFLLKLFSIHTISLGYHTLTSYRQFLLLWTFFLDTFKFFFRYIFNESVKGLLFNVSQERFYVTLLRHVKCFACHSYGVGSYI